MRSSNRLIVGIGAALASLGVVAGSSSASSPAASPGAQPREIQIVMTEFKFSPDSLEVAPGETVHFVIVNQGAIQHELVFGDQERQDEHEAEMASGAAMAEAEPGEGEAEADPGQTTTLDYAFPDQPGTLLYGCHVPGHWAAGMKGTVTVK